MQKLFKDGDIVELDFEAHRARGTNGVDLYKMDKEMRDKDEKVYRVRIIKPNYKPYGNNVPDLYVENWGLTFKWRWKLKERQNPKFSTSYEEVKVVELMKKAITADELEF